MSHTSIDQKHCHRVCLCLSLSDVIAGCLSLYQLVLSMFVYVYLYQMLAGLLYNYILFLSFLTFSSSSAIIVHLFSTQKCQFYCQRLLILRRVNACMSTFNFLGLCCEGICDRQTDDSII